MNNDELLKTLEPTDSEYVRSLKIMNSILDTIGIVVDEIGKLEERIIRLEMENDK